MKRSAPMKRTAFARQLPPPRPAKTIDYTPRPRAAARPNAGAAPRLAAPAPKERAVQHQAYMTEVRTLPCYRCGVVGFTQFCHADEGKGQALKTDCRRGWPGCGPHHDSAGCHWLVGTSGRLPRAERREFEREASSATRARIRALGLWPTTLPAWPGDHLEALEP